MICLDTNIVIYIGNGTLGESIVGDEPLCYASITLIESLGYTEILSSEEQRIKELLETMTEIPLSDPVIQTAISLKQLKKISLGDSIIAATALENDCTLWTANVEDFSGIDGLKIYNPLKPRV